jgi:hypothetical protein
VERHAVFLNVGVCFVRVPLERDALTDIGRKARSRWGWKDNPNGAFVNWHPHVSCNSFVDPKPSP